jgi:hypothetical protein
MECIMKILGINRVELVVRDPDQEAAALGGLLGVGFDRSVTEEHGVLSRTSFEMGLELAGPTKADSVMNDILDREGEGLLTIVFRVDSADAVVEMAKKNGLEVVVDLDYGDGLKGYKCYRQVSLRSDQFPAQASFTFAEYEEA